MKKIVFILTASVICLSLSYAIAGSSLKGKAYFNDKEFAWSTNQKSCNSCHPNGKGLGMSGEKSSFKIMGNKLESLEEVINFCIENALEGQKLKIHSEEMQNMMLYIKTIKAKKKKK